MSKLGRNDPCHCGSGRKYKQCCLAKDEAAERHVRAEAEAAQAASAPAEPSPAETKPARPTTPGHAPAAHTRQPWKRGTLNAHGFQKLNAPRKVGGGS